MGPDFQKELSTVTLQKQEIKDTREKCKKLYWFLIIAEITSSKEF